MQEWQRDFPFQGIYLVRGGDEITLSAKSLGGLKIRKLDEQQAFFDIFIYGDAGVGKTVLSGSADAVPQMRPVLFVDIEFGTNSLRKTYPKVDVVQVRTMDEVNSIKDALSDTEHGYQTAVFDSLTELQKLNMYHIMKKNGLNPLSDKPTWDEWALSLENMRKFVRDIKRLPINSIFTALLDTEKDKRGNILMKPLFTGKFQKEAAALFDEVFFYYMREIDDPETGESRNARILLTEATETATAKDRSGNLGQYLIDPNMTVIYNKMIGTE